MTRAPTGPSRGKEFPGGTASPPGRPQSQTPDSLQAVRGMGPQGGAGSRDRPPFTSRTASGLLGDPGPPPHGHHLPPLPAHAGPASFLSTPADLWSIPGLPQGARPCHPPSREGKQTRKGLQVQGRGCRGGAGLPVGRLPPLPASLGTRASRGTWPEARQSRPGGKRKAARPEGPVLGAERGALSWAGSAPGCPIQTCTLITPLFPKSLSPQATCRP